jgi:parallel beta-helix repeat protein
VAFSVAGFAQTANAAGGTEYVNQAGGSDTGTCRLSSAPCATITYALSQATNGTTIKVAGGTYDEQLTVSGTQNVSIAGSWVPKNGTASPTIVQPSALPANDVNTDSSTQEFAIVDAQPGAHLNLTKLTLDGSAGQSQFTDCTKNYVGAYYHDASGSMTKVTATNIALPTALSGCQDGLGVFVASDSGTGTPSNVSMTSLTVNNYQKNGIVCKDGGTNCAITKSKVTGNGASDKIAQNGIEIANDINGGPGATATVTHNTVSQNSYTDPNFTVGNLNYATAAGILVIDSSTTAVSNNNVMHNDVNIDAVVFTGGGTPSGWTIENNVANNAENNTSGRVPTGYGVGDGIVVDGAGGATVSHNKALHNVENGLVLAGTTNTTADHNTTSSNGAEGIHVGGGVGYTGQNSASNTVSNNTSNGNGTDGILADVNTGGNQFTTNVLKNDGGFDARDQSSGGGTAGTDNNWTGNTCTPAGDSSPAGLCP